MSDRLRAHLLANTQHRLLIELLNNRSALDALWTPLQGRHDGETEYELAVKMAFAVACRVTGRDPGVEAARATEKDEPEMAMKSNWTDWGVPRFSVLDL